MTALAGIIGNMLGGNLVKSIGLRGMFGVSAVIVLVTAALYVLTLLIGKRKGLHTRA